LSATKSPTISGTRSHGGVKSQPFGLLRCFLIRALAGSKSTLKYRALVLLLAPRIAAAAEPTDVFVEGDKTRAARDRSAASFVLREDELALPGASTAEALSRSPGVQVTRSGASPDLATAQVRGASSAQTPVYLAGIRLNDEITGIADLSTVPLSLLGRVEVYRGVVPLWADRSAIGGAVVLEPRLPDRTRISGLLGAGSFGEASALVRLDARGRLGASDLRSSTVVRFERSDNDYAVHDDRGTPLFPGDDRDYARPNADASALELLHVSRFDFGSARAVVVVSALAREQGVTGLGVLPALAARAKVERVLAGASVRLPFRVGENPAWVELVTSGLFGTSELRDPAYELSLLSSRVRSEGIRGAQSARVGVEIEQRARFELGFTGESELLSVDRDRGFAARASRRSARASLGAAVRIVDAFHVVAMGALDCQTTDAATPDEGARVGRPCGLLEPTARLGVRAVPATWLTLLANASRAIRAPTLGELFGTSPIVRGNPDLVREEALGGDVGARVSGEAGPVRGELEVFGFARASGDLIAFQRSSLGIVRPFNVASARTLGLEAYGALRLFRHVELACALTLLDPRDTSPDRLPSNDLLPYQSQVVVAPALTGWVSPQPQGVVSRLAAGTRLVWRSERVADRAALVRIPEQASWDVDLSASLFGGRLALRVAAKNLLDQRVFDVVGFPLAGRSFHGTIEGGFP